MERIGFQRLARIFLRHVLERARPGHVDSQCHEQNEDGGDARLNMHAVKEEPVKCFVNDVKSSEEKQCRLDKCGEIFKFAVAIWMAFICWFIRHAHGEKCDNGREQVESRVQRLGEDA